jgi:putative nucleotidyltransferase with HDIG domain
VTIPTLPEVVLKVNELLENPDTGLREIAATITKDAPITTKVLRIANSAYYGLRQEVMSAEHAASVLGARALRNIVLQASVIRQFDHLNSTGDLDVPGIWKHSILTAQVAQVLGQRNAGTVELTPDELYTCGLLHNLGRIVLLNSFGEEYIQAVRDARERQQPVEISEGEVVGIDHMETGAWVAKRWGLPEGIIEAIRHHHSPDDEIVGSPSLAAIALAGQTAAAAADQDQEALEALRAGPLPGALGMKPEVFEEVADFAMASYSLIEL